MFSYTVQDEGAERKHSSAVVRDSTVNMQHRFGVRHLIGKPPFNPSTLTHLKSKHTFLVNANKLLFEENLNLMKFLI